MTNQEEKKYTKDQLKVMALKQRIGEITSRYEDEIADLRADVTQRFEAFNEVIRNQETDIESLQAQLRKYQDEPVQEEADGETSQD
jgi:spore maturation protein CgeB